MSKLLVSIDHIEFTAKNDIFYVIKVTQNDSVWHVGRTNSEFRHLRNDIVNVIKDETLCCPVSTRGNLTTQYTKSIEKLILPPWRLFGKRKDHVQKERATILHHFLSQLLLLTHKFRKAEQTLYNDCPLLPSQMQASVHAMYQIKKFLEPSAMTRPHSRSREEKRSCKHEKSPVLHRSDDKESVLCATDSAPDRIEKKHTFPLRNVSLMPAYREKSWKQENAMERSKEERVLKNSPSNEAISENICKADSVTRNRHIKDMERMSRLSSQLTAQRITIDAQKELESVSLTEYEAIMVLRYVDRFINKAVGRAPGCYVVTDEDQLRIDSERFLAGLEETFSALPKTFYELFKDRSGEWRFPVALNEYVQLKWDSFHGSKSDLDSFTKKCSDIASEDDSESEYEYENVTNGGFMKARKPAFSQEEADVLQEMIACGTAGRDQELRFRRQMNEQKWIRRDYPPVSSTETSSDRDSESEEEEEEDIGPNGIQTYQQQMNAKRRDRLNRVN